MGAGTTPLGTGASYNVTLTFDPPIQRSGKVYDGFKSALDWLLRGLVVEGKPGFGYLPDGGDTIVQMTITVKLAGELGDQDAKNFSRAFNRLLWGIRHQLHDAGGNQNPGADSKQKVRMEQPNWLHEPT